MLLFLSGAVQGENHNPQRQPWESSNHTSVWFLWWVFTEVRQCKCMEVFHRSVWLPATHSSRWWTGKWFCWSFIADMHTTMVSLQLLQKSRRSTLLRPYTRIQIFLTLKYFSTMQYSISSNMGHMNVQEWMQKTRRKIQHLLHKNTIQNCGKNPVLLQKKWKGYNVVFWCRPTYHIDFFSFVWGRQATEPFCVCAVVIDHITCRLTFEHWNFHCIHAYQCFDR